MKIIVDSVIPFIRGRFPDEVDVDYVKGDEFTYDVVKDADALIVRTRTRCDANLLKDSNVKMVATATIGTDHIDIPWCENHGVDVKSAPGCNAPGVAQYVFSSIFKVGFDYQNDVLGIIGYGNVGGIVADWANKMGIKTLISDDPRKNLGLNEIEYLPIEEVLKHSDVVTLHVPFTKEGAFPTYKMIGKDELGLMKQSSIIINSSRGGVVDEGALKDALADGNLRAIIDVWDNEPDIDRELMEMAEIATPHIAGYSAEGKMRATRMVLDAVGKKFGIPVDLSGLECEPSGEYEISKKLIEDSYDPLADSEALKSNPVGFESFRNHYAYRHEPLFNIKMR